MNFSIGFKLSVLFHTMNTLIIVKLVELGDFSLGFELSVFTHLIIASIRVNLVEFGEFKPSIRTFCLYSPDKCIN